MKKIGRAIITLLILAGCSHPQNNQTTNAIKIGVIQPLSGPASTYGQDVVHGLNHMLTKINQAGGVNNAPIQLIIEDGKCNGKDAVAAINKLINVDQVPIIIGGGCSSETIPAAQIAQQKQVLMLSPISSSPEISYLGDYIFRYRNTLDAAIILLDYIQQQAQSIAIIHEQTDYATDFAKVIAQQFSGTIQFLEKFQTEEKDFTILAKKVIQQKDNFDYLIFVPQTESTGAGFIQALHKAGGQNIIQQKTLSTVTTLSQKMIELVGDQAAGIKGPLIAEIGYFNDKTQKAMKEVLGGYQPQSSYIRSIFAADALQLVAEGIQQVGYDATALKQHFEQIDAANPRQSLFGSFRFDAEGDVANIPFDMFQIKNQGIVPLK